MKDDSQSLPELVRRAKLRLLRMHFESGVGHIGGNLSALHLLICLHHQILQPEDVFVLSKGHSAGGLYSALWSIGALTDEDLKTFHKDGTRLSGHPPVRGIPQIQFATGSLGHGLGLASGVALAKRLRKQPGHVFCLMSDGEWNEGSCWEALIFVAQQRLENLTIIVDLNGLQGFGTTSEVANLSPIRTKLADFGLCAIEVDGHDCREICTALRGGSSGPRAVVARTIKGCGVSFMENRMEWHYLPMSKAQYLQARQEVLQA